MAQNSIIQTQAAGPAREFDLVLIVAIAISALAVFGVYVALLSDESVPNYIIAVMTIMATVAVVFTWGVYWSQVIRRRFAAIEARLVVQDEERAVDELLGRLTGPDGPIRPLPNNVRKIR